MCDEFTEADNHAYLKAFSRRKFSLMAGGAGVSFAFAGCAPGEKSIGTSASGVTESDVMINTPDGTADAYFAHPASGKHPAVLVWPDVTGLRPAMKMMAKRLASDGYSVLVINPYYRSTKAPIVEVGETYRTPGVRERIKPLRGALSQETNRTDATAFIDWLDAQASVDTSRKIGTTGYCMGGPMTMITAAHRPDRIGAGASFHGGGLATDKLDSPHLLIPQMNADFLIAIAENDDERGPEAKTTLREAFAATDNNAEIEVYAGAMHGWCPPDSTVYNEVAAEKAWSRKLALFERTLG